MTRKITVEKSADETNSETHSTEDKADDHVESVEDIEEKDDAMEILSSIVGRSTERNL